MRLFSALFIFYLLASDPVCAANGQLVLACGARPSLIAVAEADWHSGTVLVFDFDRGMVFRDGSADGVPEHHAAIKKFFIIWKSNDGTRGEV